MGESFQKHGNKSRSEKGKTFVKKEEAEHLLEGYLKAVLGFALKRCKSSEDAEDLSQEIILKAYRALLTRNDVEDTGKFIWTVAHNALCNYYRDVPKNVIGIPVEELEELLACPEAEDEDKETLNRLRQEIAYLTVQQRKIVVAYYFENKKQEQIARELGISTGTVKWHLFGAKKELRKGMNKMREASNLKFHPIQFTGYGINGSSGTKSPDEFFRSILPQNICYAVRNSWKSVNEIADDLGVSPVFVEGEAEFLEEYGFLEKQKNRFRVNFLLEERTTELLEAEDKAYKAAAALYADALFTRMTESGILEDEDIRSGYKTDTNYLMWALLPYATANSRVKPKNTISFREVATIRPDGGENIFHASVGKPDMPEGYVEMRNWCGPMWNNNGKHILWQVGSDWSEFNKRHDFLTYPNDSVRIMELYERSQRETLSRDEYAWLAEQGMIRVCGSAENPEIAWQIVILKTPAVREKLLDIEEQVRNSCADELAKLRKSYATSALECVPQHMRRTREYELQYTFYADGRFLHRCLWELIISGRLKLPTEEQKASMSTLLLSN